LGAVLGHSLESPGQNTALSLLSYLSLQVPEMVEDELAKTVKALFEPSEKHPLDCLFEITAFFASNNKITEKQMKEFLKWVLDENHTALLVAFLRTDTATTRVFSQHIVQAAVSLGDKDLLRSMIHVGADFHLAIEEAILIEDYDFVELLLSRINKPFLSGESGGRLLLILGRTNNVRAASILIENGANVNINDGTKYWNTPLLMALKFRKFDLVKVLIEKGANVNRVCEDNKTPLTMAVNGYLNEFGLTDDEDKPLYMDIIKALLDYGADVQCSIHGMDLVEYVSLKDKALYRLLLEKSNRTASALTIGDILDAAGKGICALSRCLDHHQRTVTPKQLETALHASVCEDNRGVDTVSVLLTTGVNPNTPTLDRPPLMVAMDWPNLPSDAIARLLIKAGADVNVPDLLCSTVEYENIEVLNILLDAGADLELFGPKALVTAVMGELIEVVAILIDRGVDLNIFGDDLTPFQAAASLQRLDFVKYLLDRGTEQNINTSALVNAPAWEYKGCTAIQAACKSGNIEMVTWLLAHDANVNAPPATCDGVTPLEAVMKSYTRTTEKVELIRILLDKGMKITKSDEEESRGILHAIINVGQTELLDIVLNAGMDVNQSPRRKEGRTPLQLAAELGRLDIVQALYNRGADINARPAYQFGRTALQAAATSSKPNMDLLRFLVDKGANVNAAPGECGGISVIQGAAIAGNIPVIQYLISKGARVHGGRAFKDGRTAIEGAAEHGRLDTVHFLLEHNEEGNRVHVTEIQNAIDLAGKNKHFEVVNLLKAASI
jgi:ankyrin repeat protein